MKLKPRPHRLLTLALATATALPLLPAYAQQKSTARNAAPAAQAAVAKSPLDNLDESKLMAELANRGLTNLLDFYFQKNNVPDEKRKEIVVLIALQHLDSRDFASKSAADRKKEIDDIVAGINNLLPTISDPQRLLRYASALISNGTLRLINILDYWGDNPRTQAALNPIADTVDKILDRAVIESKAKADGILNRIKGGNDPLVQQWEEADQIAKLAEYNKARSAYGLALSYDKAAINKRAEVCKKAIESLAQFDEEGSNVRVPVELDIAKLNMAMGPAGYAKAKEYFAKVIGAQPDAGANPKQYLSEQYQARYFTLIADVLNQKADAAEAGLTELKSWQDANLAKDKGTQQGVDAATSMLEYRIFAGKADAAKGPKEREKLNNDAIAILMDLVSKRPDLRSVIFEQVMGKLPDNPDLTQLNPLLLEAIVTRGIEAIRRKTPEKDDAKNIQLAADAARQIVASAGKPGITADQVDSSAFRIGVFEEHIGSTPQLKPEEQYQNKLDAATAYITYVEKFGGNKTQIEDCLDNALPLLATMRKADSNDDKVNALYDHALEVALFKAGRTQVAMAYAQRRREVGDLKAARKGYALVKSDVPRVMVFAKYQQMFCDQQLLDQATDADKPALSADVQRLAEELNPIIDNALPKVDAESQNALKLTKARMVLLAAAVAKANKQPDRVVTMLNGYETLVNTFPPETENALLGQALFLRVYGLMATGKNTQALAQIDALVAKQGPERSLRTITELLVKLDEGYRAEKGKENPDAAALTMLSGQRAQLAQFLVEQTQKNAKLPEANRREYLSFNARVQIDAAELDPDAAKKKSYVDQAMATYTQLLAAMPKEDPNRTTLLRDIALAQFRAGDAANLQLAHDTLQDLLLGQKVLGGPLMRNKDSEEAKPNPSYWEAYLRLLQAKQKLTSLKGDTSYMDDAKKAMKNLIIQHGDQTGGPDFKVEFKKLRQEILGDWKPETAPPASRPVK